MPYQGWDVEDDGDAGGNGKENARRVERILFFSHCGWLKCQSNDGGIDLKYAER